ncbi:hypothetical protein M1563_00130 [Patescibacteria group bacterium]|nr:hypothetical protein [Patescibacteria group bacterium]
MRILLMLLLSLILLVYTAPIFARTTPEDIYQAKRSDFNNNLTKMQDQTKKQLVMQADQMLKTINLAVCARFDVDIARLAAVLEEEKNRQSVTSTRVAYGQGNTPLDSAAYSINYAEEAIAYQKVQDYTPQISNNGLVGAVTTSMKNLKTNLLTLRSKILNAKTATQKALDYYEK